MNDQTASKFLNFCARFDHAMLITHGDTGLTARPMLIAKIDEHGNFWFCTDILSGKVEEIQRNPQVCVTMTGPKGDASVQGNAFVVRDLGLVKQYWKEPWRVWFPQGPNDPSLALIKVDTEEGAYWETSGPKGLAHLFKVGLSYIQGKQPIDEASVHGVIQL